MTVIRGLVAAEYTWRASYAWRDDDEPGGLRVEKHKIVGWAAQGEEIWPVRIEASSARGVLVGSDSDPDREALLYCGMPGDDWEAMPWAESRVREILYGAAEGGASDAKTGERLIHTDDSCTAKTRDGDLCKNPPMVASPTCRMHGSATKAARAKAQERIEAAADHAAAKLIEFMNSDKVPFPVRLAAAKDLLDRGGLKAGTEITVKLPAYLQDFTGLFVDVVDGEVVEDAETLGHSDRALLSRYPTDRDRP